MYDHNLNQTRRRRTTWFAMRPSLVVVKLLSLQNLPKCFFQRASSSRTARKKIFFSVLFLNLKTDDAKINFEFLKKNKIYFGRGEGGHETITRPKRIVDESKTERE